MATRLWTEPSAAALATLGEIYADRSKFAHAESSLPSWLLCLRDPDQFGICFNATMPIDQSPGQKVDG